MTIDVLELIDLGQERRDAFADSEFTLHSWTDRKRNLAAAPAGIKAVITNGDRGLTAVEMDQLPQLSFVGIPGVGHEGIDLAAAAARGIVVANGAGANAVSVADHAVALLLAVARDIPCADAAARSGRWAENRHLRPGISGRRIGIVGLGRIGLLIAQRAANGFGMQVAYHNRRARADVDYAFMASVPELAAWADFLVFAAPGGAETRHLANAAVLDALGPNGFLINVGRGSIVDTDALVAALEAGRIGGAGLDVVDGEPDVPAHLARQRNLVLTPHLAARSLDSFRAMGDLLVANLRTHFAGQKVSTRLTP